MLETGVEPMTWEKLSGLPFSALCDLDDFVATTWEKVIVLCNTLLASVLEFLVC